MRKIICAFLSLFLCWPSVANVMIPADAVISTVQEFVPADRNTAVISEYNKLLTATNGAGISAQALWDICKVAGWDISSESGKVQCEQFATELLSRASVSFYPACDKKYKGKSSYVCVDDFFTNKIYGGTQVNLTPGQTLAQEYARLKHNDSSVLCKSDFDKGVLDYKLMCTSYKQNTYYEFVFDDLEEPKDKIIQDSIQNAICRMYDAKPTTAGCAGGGTNVSGTTTCWSASCAADSAKCAKINQSMAKFGYIARYKNNKCEIDFNTIYKREELKTAYDIDNFVFCHGIQVSNTPNVETYLKQYVADRAGVSETSVKCDSGFKTYTGTGCTRDGITDFKDDIKTCYVGDNQIDFVFDDINEKWKKTVEGGVQGMSCIVTGGTYSGARCIGLGEQQCNILRQSNLTECPECKAAEWDAKTQTCVLPSSASAQNLQRGINIALIVGGAIAGVVITVATVGTATAAVAGTAAATKTAIAFTAIETVGAGIEVAAQLKIDAMADNFLVESNKCHDATCAKEMLSQNLQRMANLQNDMTPAEADAVDSEMARLANLIPDDDDIWATMLVNGTDMADNKLGFFDFDSWEPEQVWRAVGIGLQLASLITGITKWAISKSSRIAKSTVAIKQKFTRAVQSIDNTPDSALTTNQLAVKRQLPNKTKAIANVNSFDDIDTITKKFDDLTKKRDMLHQQMKEMRAKYNLDHNELCKQNPEYKQLFDDWNQTNKQIIQMRKSHPELWKPGEDVALYMDIDNLNKKLDETEAEYVSYLSELESKEKELTTKLESIPKQTTEQQKAVQMAKTRYDQAMDEYDEMASKVRSQFDEAIEARDSYQSAFFDEYYDKHGNSDGFREAMEQTEEYKRLQNDVEFWGEKYDSARKSYNEELNSSRSNWIEANTDLNPEYVTVSNELEYVKALKDDALKTAGDIRNVTFWEAIPQEIKNKLPNIRDEEIVEILASDDELTWFVNNFDKVESDPDMYSRFLGKLEEGLNSRHQFSEPVRLEALTGQELKDKYGRNNFIYGSNGMHIGQENVVALNTERGYYKGLDETIALIKHETGHAIDSYAPNDGIIGKTLSEKILPSHGNADNGNRVIEAVSPSGLNRFSVSDITQEQMDQLMSEGWRFEAVADTDNYNLYRKELTEQSSWSIESTENIKDKVNAYREQHMTSN